MVGRKASRLFRVLVVTLLLAVLTMGGILVQTVHAAVSSPEVVTLLQDVTSADGFRYRAVDDQHVSMDTVKIIPNPRGG